VSGFAAQKSSRAARKAKSTVLQSQKRPTTVSKEIYVEGGTVGDHVHSALAVAKEAQARLESPNTVKAEALMEKAEARFSFVYVLGFFCLCIGSLLTLLHASGTLA
jgi:hypothetical protein